MLKQCPSLAAGALLFLAACSGDPASGASGAPTSTAAAATTATARSTAAAATQAPEAPAGNLIEVDLSSAGADYKGMFLRGPGAPKLLSKPGAPVVQFARGSENPTAPEFMVTIEKGKLDRDDMKKWVTDWAKDRNPPGKVTFVTDKPGELEYTAEFKDAEGKPDIACGFGVEVQVGGETFACSAPNLSTGDLPTLKRVCQTLAKK